MKVTFAKTFIKDVKQTPTDIKRSLGLVISTIEAVDNLAMITNCKKLQGSQNAYRIRIRNYRATFLFIHIDNTVMFQHILSRGQIYKKGI